MKKTFKKILATVLCVVMVFGSAPLAGFVGIELPELNPFIAKAKAEAATEDYYTYTVSDGEATISDVDTSISGDITVPSTLGDYPVTSIGESAFYGCVGLTSITIHDSVTSIGNSAFYGCTGLTSVTLGNSITSIGESAFYYCSNLKTTYYVGTPKQWEKITLGSNNSILTNNLIFECLSPRPYYLSGTCGENLTWKLYTNGELEIKGTGVMTNYTSSSYAPWYSKRSKITSVSLSEGLTSVGNYAFSNCTGLTSITIPDSVTNIGNSAFYGCTGLVSVTIGNSVTNIGHSAFYGCTGLTSVTIPNSITSIGSYAFYDCNAIKDVYYIGNVVGWCAINFVDVYSNPMRYADNLYIDGNLVSGELVIPDSITNIGNYVFYNCTGLTSITLPDSVTSIGKSAFDGCNAIKDVYYIGNVAGWCAINFVDVYSNPVYYADNLYIYGNIVSGELIIPDSVTSIGNSVFSGCAGLTSIIIPDSVTSIGNSAFYGCTGLTSITIPDSVTSIGDKAFYDCTGLTSITIPNSVTSIGGSAFSGCTGLTVAYYVGTLSDWNKITVGLYNTYLTQNLIFECDSDKTYYGGICGDNLIWKLYTDTGELEISGTGVMTNYAPSSSPYAPWYSKHSKITSVSLSEGLTSIGEFAFYNCTGLTSVTIPDSVTSIGRSAFSGCTGLTSATIGNGVTSTGVSAFYGCTGLTSVIIPDSVTSIGGSAFHGCTGLTSVTIPDSVTSIDGVAFYGCTGLTSITIPDSVTSIGESAFRGCTGLTSVTIGNSVTSIGSYAFYGCTGLTGITIPDGVTSIGSYAFCDCTGLTGITLPDSVTSIGNYAFRGCTGLTSATIPDSVTSIGNSAFDYCSNLKTTYYVGTPKQWEKITLGSNNSKLTNNLIFEYLSPRPYYLPGTCGENLTWKLYANGELEIGGTGVMTNYTYSSPAPWYSKRSKITSVSLSEGLTSIGEFAFYDCTGLTSVTIPDSVTSIGNSAFYDCNAIKNVYYIGNVAGWCAINFVDVLSNPMYYADNLYIDGNLVSGELVIPDGVTSIGNYAFYKCTRLTSITLPDSVTSIGNYAFDNCARLTSATIPDSVTSIGNSAFSNCTRLSITYYTGTQEDWSQITVGSSNTYLTKNIVFECDSPRPYYSSGTCGENLTWKLYTNGELEIKGTGVMANYTSSSYAPWYSERSKITSVSLSEGLTSIGEFAFYNCTGLTSVTIPDSVTNIGNSAFYGCTGLTSVTFGANSQLTSISNEAFYNCTGLTSITIPDSVTNIGGSAFQGCTGLTSVTIPDSVTSIGRSAFSGCTGLTSATIGNGVKSIGLEVFSNCTGLTSVTIGNNVTSIASYAFYGCTELASITIPDSLKIIGHSAFDECYGLSEVYYDGNSNEWYNVSIGAGNEYLTDFTTIVFSEYRVIWIYGNETLDEYVKVGNELIPPDLSEKAGYTFIGWTPEIPESMPANDLEFMAIWSPNSYDAVFDANGGTWANGETERAETIDFNSEIVAPKSPSKAGYIFSGWSYEEINLGTNLGVMDNVNGKMFKAVWIASTDTVYTVETYIMNADGEYEKFVQTFTGETDSTVTAEYTVEEGFTFNERMSAISGIVAADNSLVLKVYIDRNTYTFTTVVDGISTETEYFYGSIVAEPMAPSKTGYTFVEWDNQIPATMPANNVTVTACYDRNVYCFTTVVDNKTTTTNYYYDESISRPANPVKAGYKFIGWDKEIPSKMPANDVTVIANFELSFKMSIRNPSTTTISYGDRIILHADMNEALPNGWKIEWTSNNGNFSYSANSENCTISPNKSGDTTFTVTVYDENGNEISKDTQTMKSKAGFFDKFAAFFRKLFGMTKIIQQSLNTIY